MLEEMRAVRDIVSRALEARDRAKIKVRQPLQKLTVDSLQLAEEYLALIRDEVNVKTVESGTVFALDTTITEELREEGIVRDFIREIQADRKEQNRKPGEPASWRGSISPENSDIILANKDLIERTTHTTIVLAIDSEDKKSS